MLVDYGTGGEIFHLLEDKALVAGHTRWHAYCICGTMVRQRHSIGRLKGWACILE